MRAEGRWSRQGTVVASLVAGAAIWEVAALFTTRAFWAPLSATLASLLESARSGVLYTQAFSSFQLYLTGLALAILAGAPLGLLLARVRWLRVAVENSQVVYSGLLIGDVKVHNVTPPDFPAWQALNVRTIDAPERCESAPYSTFVIQNPVPGQTARLVINGVSLDLNGTLAVQTTASETVFFTLSGEVRATAGGQQRSSVAG